MVDCWLPYGNTEIYVSVDLNDLIAEAKPRYDEQNQINNEKLIEKIITPTSGKTLNELVKTNSRVSVVVEGTTPPKIASLILKQVINELVKLIVPTDRITIIIGNGVREQSNPRLFEEIKEQTELSNIKIIEHTRATTNLVRLGETIQGTPITVNKEYYDSNLKIAIGETRISNYMGFTGAFNAVFPGLSSINSYEMNRKLIYKGQSESGIIELNPIKEDTVEAVKKIGLDLAINFITLTRNQLKDVFTGSFEESWGQSINGLGDKFQVKINGNNDILIMSAGGSTHDYTLLNSLWCIQNAVKTLKKNACIILVAECSEGLGSETFTSLVRVEELSEFERRYKLGADVLGFIKKILKEYTVILVSALPSYLVEPIGFETAKTLNEAYTRAKRTRRGNKTVIVPYGSTTKII